MTRKRAKDSLLNQHKRE